MKGILRSQLDKSINVVEATEDGGAIESRFVQRKDDTIIIYLSSATGCNQACRFCHLTQMRQTMMHYVTLQGYLEQADFLLDLLEKEGKLAGVEIVHFNFMARGDAMVNPHFISKVDQLVGKLNAMAEDYRLKAKFKISTIFPNSNLFGEGTRNLTKWVRFAIDLHPNLEFYYSLYSLNTKFRKRWVPNAMDPEIIGNAFSGLTKGFRLHHALIARENDLMEDMNQILDWLKCHDIVCPLNIVRYNPFSSHCGEEPDEAYIEMYRRYMHSSPQITKTNVVTRVGTDVKASCGMFVKA